MFMNLKAKAELKTSLEKALSEGLFQLSSEKEKVSAVIATLEFPGKIEVIKFIRQEFNLGLKDAKEVAELILERMGQPANKPNYCNVVTCFACDKLGYWCGSTTTEQRDERWTELRYPGILKTI